MRRCGCDARHERRRVVLTGGPGAGKTAVLELLQQSVCAHVRLVPESASILFSGGFPRGGTDASRRAAQRAIYHVQRELECVLDGDDVAVLLCDRGTVDGAAYWPGPGDLFAAVGTTLAEELRRYDAVVHLRTPSATSGFNHRNPIRIESAVEAAAIDARIGAAWEAHPRRFVVDASPDFLVKARRALEIVAAELPACCAGRGAFLATPPFAAHGVASSCAG